MARSPPSNRARCSSRALARGPRGVICRLSFWSAKVDAIVTNIAGARPPRPLIKFNRRRTWRRREEAGMFRASQMETCAFTGRQPLRRTRLKIPYFQIFIFFSPGASLSNPPPLPVKRKASLAFCLQPPAKSAGPLTCLEASQEQKKKK